MCYKSAQECDIDIRRDLYSNVILSGGNTLFEGLPERLQKEIDALCPQRNMVNVIAQRNRYYSVWSGGSILTSLSIFESKWIT
jgi:actin-related protein